MALVFPKHRPKVVIQLLAGTLFFLLFLIAPGYSKAAYTLSEYVYKNLSNAQSYVDSQQLDQAVKVLTNLQQSKSLSRYEQAMVLNQLGYIYYQQGNIRQAIKTFETVTSIKDMPEALQQSSLYTLAQIYFENEQYAQSISTLKRWFKIVKNPSEEAYAFLAQAYYQTNNHQLVVDNINKALDILENKNLTPLEQWLVMLQSSYSELGLIENRISVMKWLIRIYPKKDYFLALSTAYGLMDKRTKQLSVLEIAYRKGYLEQPSEILTLASLLFSEGAPYKAAKVLQQAMNENIIPANIRNLKFLASAWISAQEFEKSIPVLKQAAAKSSSGDIDVMVGNSYFNLGQWQAAATAFQTALEKGNIDHPEKVWLLVGQCYLNLKQFTTAEKIFKEALGFEKIKKKAEKWLRYTRLEEQRYEAYQAYKANHS